jgi:prepilin-type N-terminal cleavage/methylation domain-containing protein
MRKNRAFTLLEVIISVALLGIIFAYLYSTLEGLRKSTSFYKEKLDSFESEQKIVEVLYKDITLSSTKAQFLEKDTKDFTILKLKTKNSLYNIDNPTVIWYIDKDKTLKRLESSKDVTIPISFDDIPYSFVDSTKENIEYFRVFFSKENNSILLYLKEEKKNSIFFEVNIYIISNDSAKNSSTTKKSNNSTNSSNGNSGNGESQNQNSAPPTLPGL